MASPRVSAVEEEIRQIVPDPRVGLGDDLFLLVSRLTPMLNVDLLVQDKDSRTLLTWRDDKYYPPGWHVPGGIVRFKESCMNRVHAVARGELGMDVLFDDRPIAVNEMIHPTRAERGHFIALLYRCVPAGEPDARMAFLGGRPVAGQWQWHTSCPDNLLTIQDVYRQYI
jgi:ADP-ribose pyrophosphatase YjhB (NUDIX family)